MCAVAMPQTCMSTPTAAPLVQAHLVAVLLLVHSMQHTTGLPWDDPTPSCSRTPAAQGGQAMAGCRCGQMVDLCRGPHVPNTGVLKEMTPGALTCAFWRGDATKPALQV